VLVETPAPPALRRERIGKETTAGMFFPPVRFLSLISLWTLARGSWLNRSTGAKLRARTKVKSLPLTDKFGRAITDLRISITDRCNYRCVYCRTGNEGALYGDLPFGDYLRMARVLVGMGITKIRLTGGEPLLRKGVVELVRELAKLRPQGLKPTRFFTANGTAEGVPFPLSSASQTSGPAVFSREFGDHHGEPLDIALTTNGHLLADLAEPLKAAGLSRVTVSMDAVDPDRFARITRVPNGYDHVLAGIRAARGAGLWPVKVNCVLMRGFNEDQIIPFGIFAREEGVTVRFIEFMPLEEGRTWSASTVVPLDEILDRMAEYRPLVEIPHGHSETARRYHFDDGVGEIGIIAPVSHPFCGHCSRIRITSDGKIRTCLFSVWDHDLHAQMRRGASDEELADFIRGVVQKKEARHHIGEPDFVPASRTMVHIGG
jgi:cyclic pyranopterin phosphate synthase